MAFAKDDKGLKCYNTIELQCRTCGGRFLFRREEQIAYERRQWALPQNCPLCRKAARDAKQKKQMQIESLQWQQQKKAASIAFRERLKDWKTVELDQVHPTGAQTLYILGNGFDLMHRVPSSYYSFRDALGKHNVLRTFLEDYLTPEDIWADFEASLAYLDVKAMASQFLIENWLDDFDAFDEDAGAAEFYAVAEAAAAPIITIARELPRRFEMWVHSLSLGTANRPLRTLFTPDGKVLCFNYTEFVESMYKIPPENVCYIHGCRAKRKGKPQGPLILGHAPGASDSAFNFEDDSVKTNEQFKQGMVQIAQNAVLDLIADYDKDLTKNCTDIISSHEGFFNQLADIKTIITIGHSFSNIDLDYFTEITSVLSCPENVHWYFGCHGIPDLERLDLMLKRLALNRSNVFIFPTDEIDVAPLRGDLTAVKGRAGPKEKTRCISSDGRWMLQTAGQSFSIVDCKKQAPNYSGISISSVSGGFFSPHGEYLFAIIKGIDPGILLFHNEKEIWSFVNELEPFPHQGLLNQRLSQVYLATDCITFVYNNRIRTYALSTGMLINNYQKRNAKADAFNGENITHLLPQT